MSGVLVIAPAWIGDMVMAQSLFKLLKTQDAGRPIDVLAPGWTLPLARCMPEVRAGIDMPARHGELRLGVRRRLALGLRERQYDWAIILPNSFKSALVPYWARIPRRTGYRSELRQWLLTDSRRLDRGRLPMMVQRFAALGLPGNSPLPDDLPRPLLSVAPEAGRAAAARHGLAADAKPVLALCPGAEFGPAKQWPLEHYARLAAAWIDRGWQVWLFGSQGDAAPCNQIAAQAGPGCTRLAGRTTLEDAVSLLSLAAFVVSNDSGLMHVAAALRRPLLAIYGSSDPGFTPPLSETARVERLGLVCSPCFRRTCPLGHLKCLRGLRPERVSAAMQAVMAR